MRADQILILDISSHSGRVDFQIAKSAGVDGVIMRMLVIGKTYDPSFFTHQNNAIDQMPIYGIFVNAGTHLQCAASLQEIDNQFPDKFPPLGVWVAIEVETSNNFSNGLWMAKELVKRNRGIVGIYTAKWVQDRDDKLKAYPELGNFPLWVAHYTRADKPVLPSYWRDYVLWQYSADGNNMGVIFGQTSDDADLSVFHGSSEAFYAWVNYNLREDQYIEIDINRTTLEDLRHLMSTPTIHLYYRKVPK